MDAYIAHFAAFSAMVLENGTVIWRLEQPGGGSKYEVVKTGVDPEEYIIDECSGDWYFPTEEDIEHWMEASGAK